MLAFYKNTTQKGQDAIKKMSSCNTPTLETMVYLSNKNVLRVKMGRKLKILMNYED
jgi:hypothetical protein